MTFNFDVMGLPIRTQVEVSRLPRTMDALVVLNEATDIERVRENTAFSHFRVHNQIEFKGESDPLTLWGYRLILGRANLYLSEKKVSASEMTITIVSARRPLKGLRHCSDDIRWESISQGYYRTNELLPVHLFVCNELPFEPKYYPLLLFMADRKRLRQFFERIVSEENTTYIYYAYFKDYQLIEEVLSMAGRKSKYQENRERYVKEQLPQILRGLTAQELLRGLTADQQYQLKQLLEEQEKPIKREQT